jgi:hypothetical protein
MLLFAAGPIVTSNQAWACATVAVEVTPMVVTASTSIVATAFMYMVASATTITGKFH